MKTSYLAEESFASIGNASGQDGLVRAMLRGIFDKETRRNVQAYLADAVSDAGIIDIECCFLF